MRHKFTSVSRDFSIREGLEGLTPARIITLYRRAPLLRPVSDPDQIWSMFKHASLVLSAWEGEHLIGIARVLTDGVLFSYLCDLAVEPDAQGLGISKRLVHAVLERCKGSEVVVRSSVARYYAHLGFTHVEDAWVVRAK